MARLPTPGSDSGNWGNILNEFLAVSHNDDGSLKPSAGIPDNAVTTNKIANNAVTLGKIDSALIDPAAGVAGLRTLGNGANQAMPGNATVTASAHAASHKGGGSDVIDSATSVLAGLMSATDKVKLDAIATGATANAADAQLRDRSTHTGSQTASTISDFSTATDARITAANKKTDSMSSNRLLGRGTAGTGAIEEIILGTNLSLTGTTLNAAGGAGTTNLSTTAAPTTVTINSDTGTDAVVAATDVTNAGLLLPAEKTKLGGVATGATANSTDAQLRDRATHTGEQAQSTITNLVSDLAGKQPIDGDLTTIAGLTATTDNFMQAKSGAWASRTIAEVKSDLGLTGTNSGDQVISDATITTSDITTNNFTTAKHGFVPKGTNVGNYLKDDGSWAAVPVGGDLSGPASATDNAVARFDTTTGKLVKNSTVTIDNDGVITAAALNDASGNADKRIAVSGNNFTYSTYLSHVFKLWDGGAYTTALTLLWGILAFDGVVKHLDGVDPEDSATVRQLDAALASPMHATGVGLRPSNTKYDEWLTKLTAQLANPDSANPLEIVTVGDSISSITTPSFPTHLPWPLQLNILNSAASSDVTNGWVHAQGDSLTRSMTSTEGTVTAAATAGWGSTLTNGQGASHAVLSNYARIFWGRRPAGGTINVYAGHPFFGGVLLAAIDTSGTQKFGQFTDVTLTPNLGGRYYGTIYCYSVGTTVLEGLHTRSLNSYARVINTAHAGYTTAQITGSSIAYDTIESINPDATIILVGVNDGPAEIDSRLRTLVSGVQARTDGLIVLVGCYTSSLSSGFTEAMSGIVAQIAQDTGCLFIDLASAYPNFSTMFSSDLLHPSSSGHTAIASLIRGVLYGDPIGEAYNAAARATSYSPAVPASWPATRLNVPAALDHLATTAGGKLGRSIVSTSGNVTAGATASTDYVHIVTGAHVVTLPTAVANTNRYTIKNNHTAAITVDTTLSQTIDGSSTISIPAANSVDIISNNANWSVL